MAKSKSTKRAELEAEIRRRVCDLWRGANGCYSAEDPEACDFTGFANNGVGAFSRFVGAVQRVWPEVLERDGANLIYIFDLEQFDTLETLVPWIADHIEAKKGQGNE